MSRKFRSAFAPLARIDSARLLPQCLRLSSVMLLAFLVTRLSGCAVSAVDETVTGYIQSSKLDDDDNPTEVYLFDGHVEYDFPKGGKQKELLDFVDRKVSVKGRVTDGAEGKKQLEIESYKVLD